MDLWVPLGSQKWIPTIGKICMDGNIGHFLSTNDAGGPPDPLLTPS